MQLIEGFCTHNILTDDIYLYILLF